MHKLNLKYLNDLKTSSELTIQQISELSHVPSGSIARIFSGATENPSLLNIADIVFALGGSLDELVSECHQPKITPSVQSADMGIYERTYEKAIQASKDSYNNAYLKLQQTFDERLEAAKTILRNKDLWLKRMFIFCVALTATFTITLVVVLYD